MPECRSFILNLHTPRDVGRLLRMGVGPRWPWPHGLDNKSSYNYPSDHKLGTLHRSQRRYNLADCVEIMVRHCGRDFLDPPVYHEVILQELPYIHHQDSRLEGTNEFSADRIDSSRRIRPCLPWNPGESLLLLPYMSTQDPLSSHRSDSYPSCFRLRTAGPLTTTRLPFERHVFRYVLGGLRCSIMCHRLIYICNRRQFIQLW